MNELEVNKVFENTINALKNYMNLIQNKPKTSKEKYAITCAEFDISKALTYDIGYGTASNIARGMLILDPLNNIFK